MKWNFREEWEQQGFLWVVFWLAVVAALVLAAVTPAQGSQIPPAAARYRMDYARIVRSEWGLAAPVASLAAQIHQESQWDCTAVSRVGARGCAQFMPTTAAWIGDVDHSLREGDVFSPKWAFRSQAVYMKWLAERVKADAPCERMAFALSAYNGGLGYVFKRQKVATYPGRCMGYTCEINPGITQANQRENQHYPLRILRELEPRYVNAGWGVGSC